MVKTEIIKEIIRFGVTASFKLRDSSESYYYLRRAMIR